MGLGFVEHEELTGVTAPTGSALSPARYSLGQAGSGRYSPPVRIRQYVYFGVWSESLSAVEITKQVGLAADEATIRGSRNSEAPFPKRHGWKIVCNDSACDLGEQAGRVLERLRPYAAALRDLSVRSEDGDPVVTMVLQAARWFGEDGGEEDELVEVESGRYELGGQHRLLGWHLTPADLGFLVDLRAALDVDEYSYY